MVVGALLLVETFFIILFFIGKKGYGCKWTWETIIQHYTWTQIKVKEQHFYCCSTFHSRVFNDEHNYNSYPITSVKQSLVWSWAILYFWWKCYIWTSLLFCHFNVIWCREKKRKKTWCLYSGSFPWNITF